MTQTQLILIAAEYLGVIAVMMFAGTSARLRGRRPLAFKYPMREAIISLALFAVILILAFIVYIQFFTPIDPTQLLYHRLVVAGVALLLLN